MSDSGVRGQVSGVRDGEGGIRSPAPGPGPRIIKAAAGSACLCSAKVFDLRPVQERVDRMLAAARQAVDEARVEADRILQEARRQGFEAGRAEGLDRGRLEGIERGLTEAAEVRRTLADLLDHLQQHRAALKTDAERHLIELAAAIAERVVKARIEVDETVVRRNVEAALELVTAADRLRILLAPEDVEAVKAFLPELVARLQVGSAQAPPEAIELVPDQSVGRGGCLVRTAGGETDARIETQLEEIQRQLNE